MKSNRFAAIIIAALAALLLAGCNPNPPEKTAAADTAAATAPADAPPTRLAQEGPYKFSLSLEPMPPKNLTKTTFTLMALAPEGKGLSGATITLDLKMNHPMGPNQVVLKEQSPGTYTGEGVFTMGGDWEAHITAKKGKQTGTARFAIRGVSFTK